MRALGVEESGGTQAFLSQRGHLMHHFHSAASKKDAMCQAAIILVFAPQSPQLDKPTAVGNSEAGHQKLTQVVASPERDVVADLYSLAKQYRMLPELWAIIDKAGQYYPLFVEALKLVADSDTPQDVFTPAIIVGNWSKLRSELNDDASKLRFQMLVGKLAKTNELCGAIQASDNGFSRSDSLLYLEILRGVQDTTPEFAEWCRAGLRRLSEEDWKADLSENHACCALCIELSKLGFPTRLRNSFSDALQDHANSVVSGTDLPPEWIQKAWPTVLDCIEESGTRKVLRERLVETAVAADGNLSDEFFEMYGSEIAEPTALAANDRVLSHFFSVLVKEKHIRGLAWLDEFASEHPGFIGTVKAEHTAQEFTNRLQTFVDEPEDHEATVTIESIAAHFGIVPTPGSDESDEGAVAEDEGKSSDTEKHKG
jgi:hypothetical protein